MPCLAASTGTNSISRWSGYLETDAVFLSSVIDARRAGFPSTPDNLTPRGLVLRAGGDLWIGFDTDLLRVAAVWQGAGLTPVSMSEGSYHVAGVKAPEGQAALPSPVGEIRLANGIYPGWQLGDGIRTEDPRPPAPDPAEVGRGPLSPRIGRLKEIAEGSGGVKLTYEVGGVPVIEQWYSGNDGVRGEFAERRLQGPSCPQVRWLAVGIAGKDCEVTLQPGPEDVGVTLERTPDGVWVARVPASEKPMDFRVRLRWTRADPSTRSVPAARSAPTHPRWPEVVTTGIRLAADTNAYVVDAIELPFDNPWRRNVRFADIAFWPDGKAALVTFDGDVWIAEGLAIGSKVVRWRRFASGLHEPLSVAIVQNSVVVYDRNGIWRLCDDDGDGESERRELVSNAYAQTAETREFATSMEVEKEGSFLIAKGGQQGATTGRHNGTVLRVPADGSPAEVLAYGLRMPFIGLNRRTGLITASDQQGNYVPATPLHQIRDAQFYGFVSLRLPKEVYPAPIAEPLTWIPHAINPSGVTQVWLEEAQLGPLNGALVHLGYYRPEAFVVLLNAPSAGSSPEAVVMSLTRDFTFSPLAGAVHPQDGQLYITGFQIWGTEAPQLSGLARVRYTGRPYTLPQRVMPMREGVLLEWGRPLDPQAAVDVSNYSVERWNYRRSADYGSPHFRLDGSKGQEMLMPSSAYVSRDRRRVFVGIPDLKPVMQMRLGWSLRGTDGEILSQNAYFSPRTLPPFEPELHGFDGIKVDLTPRDPSRIAAIPAPVTVEEGRRLAELMGCAACHSIDGTTLGKVGPTWKGLFGSERHFADGTRAPAFEEYLRQSIREPAARIVQGFDKSDAGMPSYEGVLTDAQIEALVLYVKSVR
ncbi:MAG: cytochrome c [Verrucomicrobiales bacterium]|nr:cytochrome c [Verrucomicrobiales bacterium]